jgi:hypothetical protein
MWRVLAILGFWWSSCIVTGPAAAQTPTPVDQALGEGKVRFEVRSRGNSTGDVILIKVQRLVPETLRLTLRPGTVLVSASGTVQDMAVARLKGEPVDERRYRPAQEIVLRDDSPRTYLIEAYCLDFNKANPRPDEMFTLSRVDERAAQVIEAGLRQGASIGVIQSALWIDREGVTDAQLTRRFPVTGDDIQAARQLLETLRETPAPVRSQPLQVLPWALGRFFDLLGGAPSRADEARRRLQEDLSGKDVAILFGLAPSGSAGRVALSGMKNLANVGGDPFMILAGPTTFDVSRGDVSAAAKEEILLTGRAEVRSTDTAPGPRPVAFSLVVARRDGNRATGVVIVDIVEATWQGVSTEDAARLHE